MSSSNLLANQDPVPLGLFDGKVAAALPGHVCTTPNQDEIPLPPMQSTADEASNFESVRKRERFRNLIQLIRLTTTILNKGQGPKLQLEEKLPSSYASSRYTYLDATARLLVRKDEVIAAAECTSFRMDDPTVELAVMVQPRNPEVILVERSQPTQSSDAMTASDEYDDVCDDGPLPSSNQDELLGTYMANPDSSFRHENVTEDKPQLLYRSSERSQETLWDNIKKNEWHYLSLPVPDKRKVAPRVSFSKHLATLESYLEDYRALRSDSDGQARHSNQNKFQKYILTSCWMKMHSRAEHWISIGIITSLCNIPEDFFTYAVELQGGTRVRLDRKLMGFLKLSVEPGDYIGEIMKYHIHLMKGQFDNPESNNGFSVDPITRNDEKDEEAYVYTSAIAVAFHRLLVSSLLSYVFRLQIVAKAVKAFPVAEGGRPPKDVITAFVQLLISAKLLFLVSHSKLFRTHLSVLSERLLMPREGSVPLYIQEFAKFTEWHANHASDKLLINSIEALATSKNSQPRSKSVQASAVKDSATEAAASEESDTGTTDEVLDTVPGEVQVVYRKWIMGMVDHFASIRVLERVCDTLPPEAKINFSILGLNRPTLSHSWDAMVRDIQTLCGDSSLASKASKMPLPSDLADKVIGIFKTKVKEWSKAPEAVNKTSARFKDMVYGFFQKLLKSEVPFTGCGHCEAILMAIIHRIRHKDDLDFTLKLHPSGNFAIAVSKSCCPVCWDIINIFNRQNEERGSSVRFQAHGRHPNLYPVDLPDILDEGIKDELLTKFSITLLKDMVSLVEEDAREAQTKHRRNESNVSQPESVAYALTSSMDGSIDSSNPTDQAYVSGHIASLRSQYVQSWLASPGDVTDGT